jgi:hypothetical protein
VVQFNQQTWETRSYEVGGGGGSQCVERGGHKMQPVLSLPATTKMMLGGNRNQMRCPRCNLEMVFDKRVFGREFQCERCGSKLFVSEIYGRMLMVISVVLGFGLPWIAHLHKLLISALGPLAGFIAVLALGFPLAFVVLFLMVRLVPRLISPPLVLRHNDPITALNLIAEREERGSGRQN